MFEALWDEVVDGPEPTPPPPGPLAPWQLCPDDSWVDELAAADPDRPRTVAEILRDAEHGPISAAVAAELAELAAIDVATLTDDQRISVAVAADRCVNHYDAVKLTAVAGYAGAEPRDDTSDAAFAW
jgi:hypothetical protein